MTIPNRPGKHLCPECSHTRRNKRLHKPVPCVTSGVMRKTPEIAPSRLAEIVDYNPATGLLVWKARPREHFVNDKAFGRWATVMVGAPAFAQLDRAGYLAGQLAKQTYRAHRVAWAMGHGEWPKGQIDHINGDRRDNRLNNLRLVNNQENMKNAKMPTTNSSGYVGVYWFEPRKRWRAAIGLSGKVKTIGYFDTKEEAAAARKEAERFYGFHAGHGSR